MNYTAWAREYFAADLFATKSAGIIIEEAGIDYASCSMEITPNHRNAQGGVMGGAIFTIADFAFAIAANAGKAPTVSLTSNITYLGAAKGNTLIAEAKPVKSGRSTCSFIVSVTDEKGTAVASVTATGFRMN